MPTNIIDGRADAVGPSGWSTVGSGLGQLGQLLAATMSAREADQAAKKAEGAKMLEDAGYKTPGMDAIKLDNGGMATSLSPESLARAGAGSGNLGVASLPSARPVGGLSASILPSAKPIEGMIAPPPGVPKFNESLSIGPATQPPDLMNNLQFGPATGGFGENRYAYRLQSPIQSMMTRNFPPGTFQYGGL